MSMFEDVVFTALGLTASIGVLSWLAVLATAAPKAYQTETLADRWRKLTEELPK